MRAVVMFESMFGNTKRIARSIADGLAAHGTVDAVEVGTAPTALDEDVELVVIGGPTHAFGMSRESTRQSAAKQADGALVSPRIGVREWLASIDRGSGGFAAAVFDTRFKKPRWLVGSAARAAEKHLRRLGFRVVAPAQSFYVSGTKGPLLDGELERARRWGDMLGSEVALRTRARRAS